MVEQRFRSMLTRVKVGFEKIVFFQKNVTQHHFQPMFMRGMAGSVFGDFGCFSNFWTRKLTVEDGFLTTETRRTQRKSGVGPLT
jgi:hypothetical protein